MKTKSPKPTTTTIIADKFCHKTFLKENSHKLVRDLTSDQYHGMKGTWSSSQFKDIIEDEDLFIKKYVTKEIERIEREAFDTGTYLHTSLLEPHKVKDEIAVFTGKVRRGSEWEKFKRLSKGKMVITTKQKEEGDAMIKAVRASPISMQYLKGEPEVSLFVRLVVHNGNIYAPKFNKVLSLDGWKKVTLPSDLKENGHKIIVKVRADTLGKDFISDLKSTSSNARHEGQIRSSISKYKYDLSAALYLDMFALLRPTIREFVWIFASKIAKNCKPWRASEQNIRIGRAKYMRGMIKLADCAQSNWEVVDSLGHLEPLPYELEWLVERDSDLL